MLELEENNNLLKNLKQKELEENLKKIEILKNKIQSLGESL